MKPTILPRSGSLHSPSQLLIGSGSLSLRRTGIIAHAEVKLTRTESTATTYSLRRARSDSDLNVSDPNPIWSPPARLTEEEEEDGEIRVSNRTVEILRSSSTIVPEEEVEFAGGGRGRGVNIGGGGGGGGGGDGGDQNENEKKKMENYYKEVLRSDPSNPLLLRNYGRFLHEVEGDAKGAEECYARVMLTCPPDGDVLSLYGKLVWETQRDEERAESYFQRAVQASPDDCYVLGSYASFLWEVEEEDEETSSSPQLLVEAF